MSGSLILGVETSCDETSAAVLEGERQVRGHVILSQDVHALYGGVVPELAARAHLRVLDDVVDGALREAGVGLKDLDAVGVTAGPGLIGALLVGACWARAFAHALSVPLVAVHHMEAHLFAPSLDMAEAKPPFVALLVSGGHTMLLFCPSWGVYQMLGETRDDAAGEAFDKVAKALGLPYPGGPQIEKVAAHGDASRFSFPRPMLRENQDPADEAYFDFSFSGLKTAVATRISEFSGPDSLERERPHVAAAFQEAAVDVLVEKTLRAVDLTGCRRVLLGGGVSANRLLRAEMCRRIGAGGRVFHSSPRLAVDNGAMVARAARFRLSRGEIVDAQVPVAADLQLPGLCRGIN